MYFRQNGGYRPFPFMRQKETCYANYPLLKRPEPHSPCMQLIHTLLFDAMTVQWDKGSWAAPFNLRRLH